MNVCVQCALLVSQVSWRAGVTDGSELPVLGVKPGSAGRVAGACN